MGAGHSELCVPSLGIRLGDMGAGGGGDKLGEKFEGENTVRMIQTNGLPFLFSLLFLDTDAARPHPLKNVNIQNIMSVWPDNKFRLALLLSCCMG